MLRLGLCCQFRKAPIKFSTTTATSLLRLSREAGLKKLADLCRNNALALQQALRYCARHRIGCFRVNSQILPLKTHPQAGYDLSDVPAGDEIVTLLRQCHDLLMAHGLRASFHPDQFILLSSPDETIVQRSIEDLEYQAEVAEWIGADVITIHGGGAYGDKPAALARLEKNLPQLSARVRTRLTLENDDKIYTPSDLLPLCRRTGLPLVYDVHHHRCHPDGMSVADATQAALKIWSREPLFHISSPKDGWHGPRPARHHDYIHPQDFPDIWRTLDITVEIEAKAKEMAVQRLQKTLR